MFLSKMAYCCHKLILYLRHPVPLRPLVQVFVMGGVFWAFSAFASAHQQPRCVRVFEEQSAYPSSREEGWAKLPPVSVPPSLKQENDLTKTGYGQHYSAGLDEVLKIQLLAREMRQKNIDPQKTHIADLADQVEGHIAFFESGFASRRFSDQESSPPGVLEHKNQREEPATAPPPPSAKGDIYPQTFFVKGDLYKTFQNLVRQVRTRVQQEQLTYPFWVNFNYRVVNLIQGTNYNERRAQMLSVMENFPNYIYFPTVHDLGIMAFNQVDTKGIILVGLIKKPVEVDGTVFHPEKFFHHDAAHFRYGTKRIRPEERRFHARWVKKLPLLPKAKRERVELIYFLLTHENRSPRPLRYTDKEYLYETILPKVSRFYWEPGHVRDMEHLLPPSTNTRSQQDIQNYLKKSADDFSQVAQSLSL